MILDSLLELSDAQAVTATAISSNVVDLGPVTDNVTRDIGTGADFYLVLSVDTAFATSTSAVLTAALVSDSTVNLATSPTTHATPIAALATASLAAGAQFVVKLPPGSYEQYVGIQYTVGVGSFTAGKINAFLTTDAQAYRAYADRQPISGNA
jgi:hypothetical protein